MSRWGIHGAVFAGLLAIFTAISFLAPITTSAKEVFFWFPPIFFLYLAAYGIFRFFRPNN